MTTPRSRVTRCVRRQLLRSSVARHICSWKEAQHVTVRTVAQLICIAVTYIPSFHVDPAEWITAGCSGGGKLGTTRALLTYAGAPKVHLPYPPTYLRPSGPSGH